MSFCHRFPSFGDGRRECSLHQAARRKEQEKAEYDSTGWDRRRRRYQTTPQPAGCGFISFPFPTCSVECRLMNCLPCCSKAWLAPCQREGRQEEDAGTGRGPCCASRCWCTGRSLHRRARPSFQAAQHKAWLVWALRKPFCLPGVAGREKSSHICKGWELQKQEHKQEHFT